MTLNSELQAYNKTLDSYCQSHWGISVRLYKILKALTQMGGAAAGVYAMSLGADPTVAFGLIAFIIGGPEAFEYLVTNGDNSK